jgi:hypothetical protein
MVVYNRRKRAIYFENEELKNAQVLAHARNQVHEGTASPAQIALVEGIAEEEAAMEKKKAERKLPSRMLWWLHGDWKEEKVLKEQRKLAVDDFLQKEKEASQVVQSVTQAVQEAQLNASRPTTGGPLDQQAAQATQFATNTVKGAGGGWFGWLSGGSKKE